jgi:hypothetical protein
MTNSKMRRFAAILSIAGGLWLAACAQTPPSSPSPEQEIRMELDALGRAVVERDAARIQRLIADEYTFTQPDTIVSGKQALLASIGPDVDFRYLEHRVTEIHTRAYGVAAVSNGRFFVRGSYQGRTIAHGVRFTAVHVHRDGRWQLVALHSTIEP